MESSLQILVKGLMSLEQEVPDDLQGLELDHRGVLLKPLQQIVLHLDTILIGLPGQGYNREEETTIEMIEELEVV